MSYWKAEKRNCVQYRRHFLVDNNVFHGELPLALVSLDFCCISDSTSVPALWVQVWLIARLNQELEVACLWLITKKPRRTHPRGGKRCAHLHTAAVLSPSTLQVNASALAPPLHAPLQWYSFPMFEICGSAVSAYCQQGVCLLSGLGENQTEQFAALNHRSGWTAAAINRRGTTISHFHGALRRLAFTLLTCLFRGVWSGISSVNPAIRILLSEIYLRVKDLCVARTFGVIPIKSRWSCSQKKRDFTGGGVLFDRIL